MFPEPCHFMDIDMILFPVISVVLLCGNQYLLIWALQVFSLQIFFGIPWVQSYKYATSHSFFLLHWAQLLLLKLFQTTGIFAVVWGHPQSWASDEFNSIMLYLKQTNKQKDSSWYQLIRATPTQLRARLFFLTEIW